MVHLEKRVLGKEKEGEKKTYATPKNVWNFFDYSNLFYRDISYPPTRQVKVLKLLEMPSASSLISYVHCKAQSFNSEVAINVQQ